ncbi:beta-carotene isomerase [Marchantia polymorpha subsp. ruderalis]|uniref:Beta-carotene isomerase D27-like C-terminal domain-containing protein n=1 Tax=Marchantia polymorpha TaxID=3197 RepID=A0A2R6XGG2_MARPO|nr:hypothetical protein MARPO_0015s0006 [Marchantia polymorpha]BBN01411.1 hypothetical protein Mp_2g07180 [Marchantia polymorpha subsp. ruderalis]|eukprot:PTQ45181.1 hypothetical protein MARPO_0015s0006 [Marchantia polymorpha]
MATVCCSALSYGILQVPYARQEGTVEIQALSRSSGVFAEVDGAQKYLRGQRSARFRLQERKNTVFCKAMQGESPSESNSTIPEYKAGPLDDLFFKIFRQKMAEEVGWNSDIPGYDGLIEVVKYLYTRNTSKEATEASTVRVLTSLFPGWLLPLFRQLIAPISDGKVAAIMTAFVTQATCQWLMGPCTVNEVVLADGSTQLSGVFVHKCKYLEESKCAGICTHTCKIPTQTFMKEKMSVPLSMEPNFNDYSCQFKYGVAAPPRDEDPGLLTPCLSICPTAATRSSLRGYVPTEQCPQV